MPDLNHLFTPIIHENDVSRVREEASEKGFFKALSSSIAADSNPRPDGFGSAFYSACRHIIKEDVMDAVNEFYKDEVFSRFYSSLFIVLIPKIKNFQSFDKFKPISLCNVIYKVFFFF